jgi:hypothetical protein
MWQCERYIHLGNDPCGAWKKESGLNAEPYEWLKKKLDC